jgi:hypothetical protein
MSDSKTLELPEGMTADTAADVLGEFHTTDDAQIVSADTIDNLESTVNELSEVFRDALQKQTDLSGDTVAAMPVDALCNEFRDDDGNIEADALAQNPETGQADGGDNSGGTDTLSADDKAEIEDKLRRAGMMESRTPDHADTLRSEAAEIAGVDDAEDIEVDAL